MLILPPVIFISCELLNSFNFYHLKFTIMKKVIFLMSIVGLYCISCTSTTKNLGQVTVQDYYNGNTYAQKYLSDSPHLLTGTDARIYINAFKHHKYKISGKRKLDNAWSTFDRNILDSLVNDTETDSVFFFLAAFPKKDKSVPDSMKKHPFIIMEAIPKIPMSAMGKGSSESTSVQAQPIFFSPIKLCPPPNTGCRFPGD